MAPDVLQQPANNTRRAARTQRTTLRIIMFAAVLTALGVVLGMVALPIVRARLARVEPRSLRPALVLGEPAAASAASAPAAVEVTPPTSPEPSPPPPPEPTPADAEPSAEDRARRHSTKQARAKLNESNPVEATSARAITAPDCEPDYELDESGRKHIKPECARPRAARAGGRENPDCDPNFELDELGRKHFKPECFVNATR